MARYGFDYGRWEGGERYDRDQGFQGRERYDTGTGYGGMRSDGWGTNWRSFPGESGWFGEASPGYQGGQYDQGYRGGFRRGFEGESMRYDRGMQGGSMGSGYGGRETGYGGFEYDRSRAFGGGNRGSSERGGWNRGRERGMARAGELMTENPQCVTPDTTLTDVAKKMRELNVGIIPVVDSMESRHLQGVITDRDIAIRAVADGKGGNTRVSECMTSDVETVNKNDGVHEVLGVMQREQVRRVPVTDREGKLVGIIAQADLVVDFAGDDQNREAMVEDTIQRISEPARPRQSEMSAQGRAEGTSRQQQSDSGTGRGSSKRQTES